VKARMSNKIVRMVIADDDDDDVMFFEDCIREIDNKL